MPKDILAIVLGGLWQKSDGRCERKRSPPIRVFVPIMPEWNGYKVDIASVIREQ